MTDHRDQALKFVGLIARMTINEEKDADGEVFYQDPFEAIGVLGELIATARQIAWRTWRSEPNGKIARRNGRPGIPA